MRTAAAFPLGVGMSWALFIVWLFLTIAGIADVPESWIKLALYWGCLMAGPLILVTGAFLVLWSKSLRLGVVLSSLGSTILSGFVIYNSVVGMRHYPLQAPPLCAFYVVLLLTMLPGGCCSV